MPGFDPGIHLVRKNAGFVFFRRDGLRSSAMTNGRRMAYWVYILASRPGGTLYVGVTNDLVRRVFEHRQGFVLGFTKRYGVKKLVYYECAE
jgi:predicted GIY-YIG superfamily endonuclease